MGIELRPRGVSCNIACKYCYQNVEREKTQGLQDYSLSKMLETLERSKQEFTLFGGEPLMMKFKDLERLFRWGFEKFGKNSIQSNGLLIQDRHIELFERYKVLVGISIDGPGALNDIRWQHSLAKTRSNTARIERTITKLCERGLAPSLIVTLHRDNAVADKLSRMSEWFIRLDSMGVQSARLHLLEVDNEDVRRDYTLSDEENAKALIHFCQLESELNTLRFDIGSDLRALLLGRDERVSCVWRACDPYYTTAVQGVEGNGQSTKCGRVNKDGVDYLRPENTSYERYVALEQTPQSENGCNGCRFFLMCKGQCPGTAEKGDWRNRSEHCGVWKRLFAFFEAQLVLEGETPLSLHPARSRLQYEMVENWKKGRNPSISSLTWKPHPDSLEFSGLRRMWLDRKTKQRWQMKIAEIAIAMSTISKNYPVNWLPYKDAIYYWGIPYKEDGSAKIEPSSLDELGNCAAEIGLTEEFDSLNTLKSYLSSAKLVNGITEISTPIGKIVHWGESC